MSCNFLEDNLGPSGAKNQPLSCSGPPSKNELVEWEWKTPFLRCFSSFFLHTGELCPGLVLVSSPIAKSAYKQHRYRNKYTAKGSINAWAFSVGGSAPLK